jgi:hypothetical protein
MEIKEKLSKFYNETLKLEYELFGPDFSFSKDKSKNVDEDGEEVKGAGNNHDSAKKLTLE